MTEDQEITRKLLKTTADSARYCKLIEEARQYDKDEFVKKVTELLPVIYSDFLMLDSEELGLIDERYYPTYVDEQWYETVRRNVENVLGPDDIFLETFEEDMKYSDTPIAASIAESLADIFQPLFDFISVVKDTDGDKITEAYLQCKEDFESYWSQTLCNVLRALNHIKYKGGEEQ